jgi:hypothetical protein
MTSAGSFLAAIANQLRESRIEFMVTGSLVSSFYGDSRTTRDIDIVIDAQEPPDATIQLFVEQCEAAGLYVATNAALGPRNPSIRRQFNVIDTTSGWKADIMWVTDREFSTHGSSTMLFRFFESPLTGSICPIFLNGPTS